MKNTIGVIGLGYVGLPLACLCAKRGYKTFGYDTSQRAISYLSKGQSHIRDDEVERLLFEAQASENFFPTADSQKLAECTLFLICVPTPVTHAKEPDIQPLVGAIKTIAPFIKKEDLIVVESTVFPGTCEEIVAPLIKDMTGFSCDGDVSLVHCPERVNPGDAFWTSENIPRVMGGMDELSAKRAAEFYSSILGGPVIEVDKVRDYLRPKFSLDDDGELRVKQVPLGTVTLMRSIRDAEAVKAMENTIRDVNIAFVNELAKISDVLNLDVVDIIDGMSTKPYGKGPYYPGAGIGGHCIAVDPEWLKAASSKAGYMPEMIQLAREINNGMPEYTVRLAQDALNELGLPMRGAKIAVLGVAYKRNVDDPRESPFYDIRKILEEKGAILSVFDSWVASENTAPNLKEALRECVGVIFVTDHSDLLNDFAQIDLVNCGIKFIVDGRNAIEKTEVDAQINYLGIGR